MDGPQDLTADAFLAMLAGIPLDILEQDAVWVERDGRERRLEDMSTAERQAAIEAILATSSGAYATYVRNVVPQGVRPADYDTWLATRPLLLRLHALGPDPMPAVATFAWQQPASANIAGVFHDGADLHISFPPKTTRANPSPLPAMYKYAGAPAHVVEVIMEADSATEAFTTHVKGRYPTFLFDWASRTWELRT